MQDTVHLAVPATPEYLRLGRVAASGLASRLGFTYEEIDDLRLAIDELCSALLAMSNGEGTVDLEYVVHDDRLEIGGLGKFVNHGQFIEPNEWSSRILDALVDQHEVTQDNGSPRFHLMKRRSE